ncbi:MAG: hypothetical protein K2Q01_00505, partial [Rickettsiales bacterium]|nr:hypothetical protein [Rickettsiales bacterium]
MAQPAKKRRLLKILIALVVAYFIVMRLLPQGPGGWGMGGAPTVSVAEVVQRELRGWSEFSGRITAVDQAEVRPQVSGVIQEV